MFIILSLIGISIAFISYKSSNDLASPGLVFVIIWFVPLSLSFLELSALQYNDYTQNSLILILGVTIIMSVIFLVATLSVSNKSLSHSSSIMVASSKSIRWEKLSIVFLLSVYMATITILLYLVEFQEIGIPLINVDENLVQRFGGAIHRYGKDSKLQILLSTDYIVGGVSFIGFIFSKRYRWVYAFWTLTPILTGTLKLSKSDMFEPLVTYSIIGYYIARGTGKSNKWIFKRIFFVSLIILLIFGFLVNLRSTRVNSTEMPYSDLIAFQVKTGNETVDETLAFYYGYSSLNFVNFSRSLNSRPNYAIGLSLFRPFFTLTLQGDQIDKAITDVKPNYISRSATVGTFMRDLYFEWGGLMVFFGAICYSIFIAIIYIQARLKPNIYTLIFYAGIGFPFIWLFFQNAFSNLNVFTSPLIGMAMIYLFSLLSRKKKFGKTNKSEGEQITIA